VKFFGPKTRVHDAHICKKIQKNSIIIANNNKKAVILIKVSVIFVKLIVFWQIDKNVIVCRMSSQLSPSVLWLPSHTHILAIPLFYTKFFLKKFAKRQNFRGIFQISNSVFVQQFKFLS